MEILILSLIAFAFLVLFLCIRFALAVKQMYKGESEEEDYSINTPRDWAENK